MAQARPFWQALPETALLRTQILGELAETTRMDSAELARLWRGSGKGQKPDVRSPDGRTFGNSVEKRRDNPQPSAGFASGSRRAGALRLAIRSPEDQAARMLLLHAALWEELSMPDHELLTSLPSWHGELFRWLERELHDQGAAEWPLLRERLAGQAAENEARKLVDDAEVHEAPTLENLLPTVERIRRQPAMRANQQILSSLGPPRRR